MARTDDNTGLREGIMRNVPWVLAMALLTSGCSGGGTATIGTDRTALGFGQEFGNAVLLGTKPAETLQILDNGMDDLTLDSVTVVSGTDVDGGALTDTAAFTVSAPSKTTIHGGDDGAAVQIVFDSTAAGHVGHFGAVLEIKSNASNAPTLHIPMTVDIVTPEVTVLSGDGSTNIALPQVTLSAETDGSGNPVTFDDGGTRYRTANAGVDVWLANSGTASLQFQPAAVTNDGGAESIFPCANLDQQLIGQCIQTGPLPAQLDRIYPDGGLAMVALGDGGYTNLLARLQIAFHPAEPGTYVQHVVVDSNATNTPELVFTVTGTAVAP